MTLLSNLTHGIKSSGVFLKENECLHKGPSINYVAF
ncbi:AAEL017461-PA [Aedes aegypti]|uniref:AAEL017461-PA n=1 Tax=Aedes aegypti TaxID=7159 RepID=J9HSK3_AEDAE|nr:AAEL017461-PA [Aedes aegypti]